jgi:DNA-binding MarR family transcriptional regulator
MFKITPKKILFMLEIILERDYSKYPQSIAKKIDITYSTAVKITKELQDLNFIVLRKSGRTNIILPTKEGKEFFEHILMANDCINKSTVVDNFVLRNEIKRSVKK